MSLADHAVRLAALHESPGFRADRFDAGPAFTGRVAVLPSAFNPPTRAHLGLLELGRAEEGISAVAALLSTTNVDKHLFGAPLAHRVGMLLALGERRPWLAVLGTNAARLADQGLALTTAFPGVGFDFIVGFDTLVRLFDPKYYTDMGRELAAFFARHRVLATNRGQANADAVRDFCLEPGVRPFADHVLVRELDPERAWMSSTSARGHISQGEVAPALAPEVDRYIREHGLYGEMEA